MENITHLSKIVVEESHLACHVGSGDLPVLATPMMIALMENAAMVCAQPLLVEGQSTVGAQISTTHIKPTSLGKTVSAEATLTKREGRRLYFSIVARDDEGVIGEAEHLRVIIDKEKFMSRLG